MARKVIGKVSVKVMPDTKQFRERLRRELKYFNDRNHIKLDVKLDERQLKREALQQLRKLNSDLRDNDKYRVKFRAEIDETGQLDAIKKARRQLQEHARAWTRQHSIKFRGEMDAVESRVEISKDSLKRAEHQLKDWVRDVSPLTVYVKPEMLLGASTWVSGRLAHLTRPRTAPIIPVLDTGAAARVGTILAALSGGRAVWTMGEDLWDSIKELDKAVPRISAITLGLTNLSAYAMAATSNIVALGGSLAAIGPTALTLPGILGGMAIGVGATVAAFRDFNEQLPQVSDQLSRMQDKISGSFWNEAQKPMERFFNKLMPQFTRNTERTGKALGGWFGDLSKSLTGSFDGNIKQMFDDLNESIAISAKYTDNFAGIITTLGQVGAASLPRLAEWFGGISKSFDEWLSEAQADGRLDDWIDTGIDNLKSLGRTIRYTGSTFAGLARAAERAGGSTLDAISKTMESVAETVNGAAFQRNMTKAFRSAHIGMSEIANHSGPQFERFMIRMSDVLAGVLPRAGRAAGKALGAIFDALDQDAVEDSLVGLFDNLERAVDELAPHMPALARALAGVVDVIGEVGVSVAKVLGPAIEHIAPKIEELADIIGPLARLLGTTLGGAVDTLGTALGAIPTELLLAATAMYGLNRSTQVLALGQQKLIGRAGGVRNTFANMKNDASILATSWMTAGARSEREINRINKASESIRPKLMTAAKGGAALAGIGIAASGVADSMGLANTASFAMMGTIAGPWGAALMGGIGLMVDMSKATGEAMGAIKDLHSALGGTDFSAIAPRGAALEQASQGLEKTRKSIMGVVQAVPLVGTPGAWVVDKLFGDDRARMKEAADDLFQVEKAAQSLAIAMGANVNTGTFSFAGQEIRSAKVEMEDLTVATERAEPAMKNLGYTWDQLGKMNLDDRAQAVKNIVTEIGRLDTQAGRVETLANAFDGLNGTVDDTATSAGRLEQALNATLGIQVNAEQATLSWQQSLLALKTNLDGAAGLRGFTQGAIDNKNAILGLVNNLESMITTNARAGDGGKKLAKQLEEGKQAIIDQATAAGIHERDIAGYLNTLELTPDLISTVLQTVGVEREERRIKKLNEVMDGLPKDLKTEIKTAGYPFTRKQLRELVKQYDEHPDKVETEIRAIIKDAKAKLKDAKGDLKDLDGAKANPEVDIDDKASKKVNKVEENLTTLGRKSVSPSVGITDKASEVIRNITNRLNALDGRNVVTTITTRKVTTNSGGGGKSKSSDNSASRKAADEPMISSRSVASTQNAIWKVEKMFDRLSASIRKKMLKSSDDWMLGVQQNSVKVENAISKAISDARNKVRNAEAKLSKANGKEAKARAKRELKQAKANLKNVKNLAKGWKAQGKEIDKAINRYREINNELLSASAELDALNQQIQSFKDSLRDSYYGIASILEAPMSTFSSMERHLENQIKSFSEFKDGLESLGDMGLSQTIIDQLASEGPEALDFIQAILKEGQVGVDRLNELWGEIERLGTGTAGFVGDYVFADELQMAQDKVDSLLLTLKELRKSIKDASDDLLKSISKGTKANRKNIVKDLNKIIKKYREMLKVADKATKGNTPGLVGGVVSSASAKTVNNDNRTYNINLTAGNGNSEADLFTAANRVKAVIATS